MMSYDIKIINGRVVDFETLTFNNTNIGIKKGKIIEIGSCNGDASYVIDARNKIVSPGFIDIHMHEEIIGNTFDTNNFDISNKMVRMGVTTAVGGNCGISWGGIDESKRFIDYIESNGSPINYLLFAGYNSLRKEVGINDRYRSSTIEEQEKMYAIFMDLLDKGVIGLSFGLEYDPGITYSEMVEFCNNEGLNNIILSAHFREDGENATMSIDELINLSKDTNLQMHISHLGSCAAVGYMKESLEVIDTAKKKGVKIEVDCYPYGAFSTAIGSAVFDEGWRDKWGKSFEDIRLAEDPYKGVTCDRELFYRIRKESPEAVVVASVMNENEVVEAIKVPYIMIASDGGYNKGQGHPRGAGTFPKVLGRYVRDLKVLSLIDALKKMTYLPAESIGLKNKGELKTNMDADIVIFDPETIIDNATFDNPTLCPTGIEYVIVNGKIAVKDNLLIESRAGNFIRRNKLDGKYDFTKN